MPLFKDQVALEACPAKTAESVSYGATFAVLGWLVLSNYSGMGYAGASSNNVADAESDDAVLNVPSTGEQATAALAVAAASAASPLPSPLHSQQRLTQGVGTEAAMRYTPLADLEAWHDSLAPQHHSFEHPRPTRFSASDWRASLSRDVQLAETYPVDLVQLSPLIETDLYYRHVDAAAPDLVTEENDTPIHEITVTGSETERLVARPDSISRPQLPRPYRAQEIQRALILPPRIQALRP